MPLPTLGQKDLNVVQLSPQLRRILHNRAKRANRREYAPILAADRAALEVPKQTYRREAGAARGAVDMVENALASSLAGLRRSGLSGGYLKQAQNEITSRMGDTAASLPFLLADAKEQRNEALGEARSQLLADRAQMQSSTASDFNQLLEQARSQGSSLLKERQNRVRSKREEEEDEAKGRREGRAAALRPDPRGVKNAFSVALNGYKALLAEAGTETEKGNVIHPPETPRQWAEFAEVVAKKADGADQTDANRAIKLLQKRLEKLKAEERKKIEAAGRQIRKNPLDLGNLAG